MRSEDLLQMPHTKFSRTYLPFLDPSMPNTEDILDKYGDIVLHCEDGDCLGIVSLLSASSKYLCSLLSQLQIKPEGNFSMFDPNIEISMPEVTREQVHILMTMLLFGYVKANEYNFRMLEDIVRVLQVDIFVFQSAGQDSMSDLEFDSRSGFSSPSTIPSSLLPLIPRLPSSMLAGLTPNSPIPFSNSSTPPISRLLQLPTTPPLGLNSSGGGQPRITIVHPGEDGPFICSHCGRDLGTQRRLNLHVRVHFGKNGDLKDFPGSGNNSFSGDGEMNNGDFDMEDEGQGSVSIYEPVVEIDCDPSPHKMDGRDTPSRSQTPSKREGTPVPPNSSSPKPDNQLDNNKENKNTDSAENTATPAKKIRLDTSEDDKKPLEDKKLDEDKKKDLKQLLKTRKQSGGASAAAAEAEAAADMEETASPDSKTLLPSSRSLFRGGKRGRKGKRGGRGGGRGGLKFNRRGRSAQGSSPAGNTDQNDTSMDVSSAGEGEEDDEDEDDEEEDQEQEEEEEEEKKQEQSTVSEETPNRAADSTDKEKQGGESLSGNRLGNLTPTTDTEPRISYVCPDCGKVTPPPRKSEDGTVVIPPGCNCRPYPCDKCEKRYKQKTHLSEHQKTHFDRYYFSCAECGKEFKRDSVYRKHMKTHSTDYEYKCAHCPKQFHQKGHLETHLERVHREELGLMGGELIGNIEPSLLEENPPDHKCFDCKKTFRMKAAFQAHMNAHAKKFFCEECGKGFSQEKMYLSHLQYCA